MGRDRNIALFVLAYFALYFVYLWWSLEGELAHWLFMVLVPALGVLFAGRFRAAAPADVLAEFGLRRENRTTGLIWAVPLGLALAALQLLVSRNRDVALDVITSPSAFYILPMALVLLLGTAATTEEIFFRGILLERLARWWRTPMLALVVSAVLFGIYHLPYAYLNPHWPSHGDFGRAFSAAMGQGVIGGLVLGGVYLGARRNLIAPVIVHALVNLVPAVALLSRR